MIIMTENVKRIASDATFMMYYLIMAVWQYNILMLDHTDDEKLSSATVENCISVDFQPPIINYKISTQRIFEAPLYVELGFFGLQTIYFLFFKTNRKKDHAVYVVHHVASFFLIIGGLLSAKYYSALTTAALHNIGDVFIYFMKLSHKLGLKRTSIAMYVVNFIVYVYLRQYWFLVYLCLPLFEYNAYYYGILGIILYVVHNMWCVLLIRLGLRVLRGDDVTKIGDDYEREKKH
jgi:hypothetical protein